MKGLIIMSVFFGQFIAKGVPSIFCLLAMVLMIFKYQKTKDKEWLLFATAPLFYILGELSINILNYKTNLPLDLIFYSFFYYFVFLFLRRRKNSLIKNLEVTKNYIKNQQFLLIMDFITIFIVSFLLFYSFEWKPTGKNIEITLYGLIQFIYPILDFLILGYYIFLSRTYIMYDRKLCNLLSIGFLIWTTGDFLYGFEYLLNVDRIFGGCILTIGLLFFMVAAYRLKVSTDKKEYSTMDIFYENTKISNLALVVTSILFLYVALYFYSIINFKGDVKALYTIGTIGAILMFLTALRHCITQFETRDKLNEMQKIASIDPLTGLYTRRFAFNLINRAYKTCVGLNMNMSALMLDIDHFKKYNDTWGHACGDQILRDLTQIICSSISISNIICRYGGEEILLVLPGASKIEGMKVAENIRENIEKYSFYNENVQPVGKVTISIGGATSRIDTKDEFELIKEADYALYESKKTRNRCSWIDDNYKESASTLES